MRKFLKYFVVLFFINFILINWVDFGWFFNYRVMANTIISFFQKENSESEAFKNETTNAEIEVVKEEIEKKDNILEIPSIGVSAPIIFFDKSQTDNKVLHEALDRGVVHFPQSVLPGEIGQTIILGHSAPPNWPEIKYDSVFSKINILQNGDEIFVFFDAKKYVYVIKNKIFFDKGEKIPTEDYSASKNTLILLSCWPPGKDYKRIAIVADHCFLVNSLDALDRCFIVDT